MLGLDSESAGESWGDFGQEQDVSELESEDASGCVCSGPVTPHHLRLETCVSCLDSTVPRAGTTLVLFLPPTTNMHRAGCSEGPRISNE